MAHHSPNFAFRKGVLERRGDFNILSVAQSFAYKVYLEFLSQRELLFLWCPVIFALGIGAYFALPFEPWRGAGLVFFGLFSFLGFLVKAKRAQLILCLIPVIFFAGFCMAQVRADLVQTSMITKKTRPIDMEGRVVAIDYLSGGEAARLTLSDLDLDHVKNVPRKVRVRVHDRGDVDIGDRIHLRGVLNPLPEPVIPGGYDFARALYFKGIGAVGYAFYPPEIVEESKPSAMGVYLERLRMGITKRIFDVMPEREASLAAALITGNKNAVSDTDRDAMRASGLAHLLAISGLHIGLVCGLIFFSVRLLMVSFEGFALQYPVKKYAAMIALCGTCFYMLMAGATIPTQRALLMAGVVLMAIVFDRMAISLRLVAFAALVVLVISPESLLSVSFQLSFAAVSGLVAFYEWARPYFVSLYGEGGWCRRIGLYFGGLMVTSLVASFSTMPFVLYHFQQIASYGLIGNIVAVPIMAFWVMPCGLLALILMPLGLDAFPLLFMGKGIMAILDVASWVQSMPGSVFYSYALPFGGFLSFVMGGVLLICMRGRIRIIGLLPILYAVLLSFGAPRADILIGRDFDVVALRGENGGYLVNSNRGQSFLRKNWESYLGEQKEGFMLWDKERSSDGLGCDESACRSLVKGYKISYVRDYYGQKKECLWADILIAQEGLKVRRCKAPYRFDRWDGWHNGAYALYLEGSSVRIKNVQSLRGDRPWVLKR